MRYSQKELEFIIDRIDKQEYELNDWEQNFFRSIKDVVKRGEALTKPRMDCLSKIWDRLEEV